MALGTVPSELTSTSNFTPKLGIVDRYQRNPLADKPGGKRIEWVYGETGASDCNPNVHHTEAFIKKILKEQIGITLILENGIAVYQSDERSVNEILQNEANILDAKLQELISEKEVPIKNVFESILENFSHRIQNPEIVNQLKEAQLEVLQKYTQQKLF
jgi:hypothetical protein